MLRPIGLLLTLTLHVLRPTGASTPPGVGPHGLHGLHDASGTASVARTESTASAASMGGMVGTQHARTHGSITCLVWRSKS